MTRVYGVALLPCESPVVHKLPILGAVIILLNQRCDVYSCSLRFIVVVVSDTDYGVCYGREESFKV